MAWTYLLIASGSEIRFALGLKYTEGFTRLVPSALAATSLR
jgi:quaternary ammonium compound-resistance protein SugE